MPSTGFLLVGAFGVPGADGFQAMGTAIDDAGLFVEDSFFLASEPTVSQVFPALLLSEDEQFWASWVRESVDADSEVEVIRLASNPAEAIGVPVSLGINLGGPAMAALPGGGAVIACHEMEDDKSSVLLQELPLVPGSAPVRYGKMSDIDHTPAVAVGEGGVLAWYRVISGIKNDLLVQQFGVDLEPLSDEMKANTGPVAPYSPVLISVGSRFAFLAWSEGVSPDFTIFGRFVDTSPR